MAPSWMKISNVGELQPRACDATIKWPVDETGMNSVSPSTMPRMAAFRGTIIVRSDEQAGGRSRSPRAYSRSGARDQSVEEQGSGGAGPADRHRHGLGGARDADPAAAVGQNQARRRAEPRVQHRERRACGGRGTPRRRELVEGDADEPEADDGLSGPGGRAGADPVVGVGPRADHRRVAHPAPPLAREAASRRRRRDPSPGIAGDGADRLAGGLAVLLPAPARSRGHERVRRDTRQAMPASEPGGGWAAEPDPPSPVEHGPPQPDRVSHARPGAHPSRALGRAPPLPSLERAST